ncbi:MAG: PAS domain S-box protein [Candidatus Eremiobacteraeota bacterium]|nr:PAS domain S-box protein [Candidatus Eremiobacteraeota bacterium]
MKKLIQVNGDRIVEQITLEKNKYKLGRGSDNDIVLDSGKVSRNHAELIRENDSYIIVDNNSVNHVYVNGEEVKNQKLVSGDKINLSKEITLLYMSESDYIKKIPLILNKMWEAIKKNDFFKLKKVTERISSLDSLDNILNIILTEVLALIDAERGFIAITDKDGNINPELSVTCNIPLVDSKEEDIIFSHSIIKRAIDTKEEVIMPNAHADGEELSDSMFLLGLRAVMCAPLIFSDMLVGVIYVDSKHELTDFTSLDQFFFSILADHAAIAIENAKLYDKTKMSVKKLSRDVEESEQKYRQLVELSPEGILVHSNGKVVFVNAKAVELFGAEKPDDILGSEILYMIHPDFRGEMQKNIHQELEKGLSIKFHEKKILRLDGISVEVEIAAAPLVYQGQKAVQVVIRDITEKKIMEKEFLKIEKLESLGILAGGIAHDFNNILTAIIGNISLARMKVDSGDFDIDTFLIGAENASLRAKNLSQQLLTFSRGGSPVKKIAEIKGLIRESTNFVLLGSNVRCDFSIAENLHPVEADEGQLSQVINNLVINAQQAMPEGGVVRVSAENVLLKKGEIVSLAPDYYVKIIVQDKGIGIQEKNLKKIFDPYFTTKQKGSGLGLATVYSVIKKHGGYIMANSKLGVGTKFEMYLQASPEEPEKKIQKEEKLSVVGGKILIMDDEEVVRKVAGSMLQFLKFEADFAKDGNEALELYKNAIRSGCKYKAVIVDLTIPGGMGGLEVIKELLLIDPEVKAIVSSGYSIDPIMSNFKDYGFSGFLSKPYKIKELRDILRDVLG